MTNIWYSTRDHLAQRVTNILGVNVTANDFERPPKEVAGDLAFGCFRVAKMLNMNPAEVAKKVVAEFGTDMRMVERVEAQGPYVNVTLTAGDFTHQLIRDVETEGDEYAVKDIGKGRKLLFEYAQPNTHKEMHVGHLRNLVLGVSLVRILRHANWNVIPVSYHGDVGAHVAKCLWWFVEKGRASATKDADTVGTELSSAQQGGDNKKKKKKKESEEKSPVMDLSMKDVQAMIEAVPKEDRTGAYLGRLYTEATKRLQEVLIIEAGHQKIPKGQVDIEINKRKKEVSQVQQALEHDDPVWHKLWQETRRWSLDEFTDLFEELGVEVERQYLESEVVGRGQEMVDTLMERGVAVESDGAIVVNLEDADLGVFLIRKSDGTSLYATKDLALAELKKKEYPKAERSILLVDNRQSLYFRQLFETLKRMGYDLPTEHVGYEFVKLKQGAMSSREGNIVTYQEFRDEVFRYAWEETKARHESWSAGQVKYTAWVLALAGMKFGMLKQDPDKVFTFDVKEALSFDGDTGPYVQYAAVRLNAILRRADYPDIRGKEEPNCRMLNDPKEKALALAVAQLGEVAPLAAEAMRPSVIANWCVETARAANTFYRDIPVLDAGEGEFEARIRLVYAARDALTIGLKLLGIPVPEEM